MNLVVYPGSAAANTTALMHSLPVDGVYGYDSGTWEVWLSALPGASPLALLQPGRAYWLRASASATWTLP